MDSFFEQIYSQYKQQIYFFVKKYIQNQDDIEDVVQDIFVHIWKHKDALHKNTEAIVFKTAKQEISNFYRKNKLSFSTIEDALLSTPIEIEEEKDEESQRYLQKIHLLLETIPEKSRAFFINNKVDGLSYSEIAKENNISKNAVAKHVNKVLDIIKSRLHTLFF